MAPMVFELIFFKSNDSVFCVDFNLKNIQLQDRPDVSETVKKSVSSWYQAVDTLSRDNWQLPKVLSLDSFAKQLRTSYKHLVINGGEIYDKANSEKTRREVDDFTREIANILIEVLKDVWVRKKYETKILTFYYI